MSIKVEPEQEVDRGRGVGMCEAPSEDRSLRGGQWTAQTWRALGAGFQWESTVV